MRVIILVHADVVSESVVIYRCSRTWMEKPQGWSSLTRQMLNSSSSRDEDPFPSLQGAGAGDSKPTTVGVGGSRRPVLQAPFVSVVGKGRLPTRGRGNETNLNREDAAVARLRERYGWADDRLLRDVLQAVGGDEDVACGQLDAMAEPSSPPPEGPGGKFDVAGDGLRSAGAVECEKNDVYLKNRREALRMSRARGKNARAAYNAYMAGDHALAKQYSREAHENWKTAEILHAQAAEEILYSRNADGVFNVWTIDLHGLHATEAVMALQERLAYLEEELAKNPGFLYSSQRVPNSLSDVKGEGLGVNGLMNGKHEQSLPLAASRAVVKSDLSVITGVGRHSKGGPSLPLAVKNFLLSNGYKFTEPRPGAVSVAPKRHYA
ncbi:uncharacterized protein [Physcomitrium patens]|uniref:Smr domain-containing protein n=1 Tax=Physcomitrium patens TaxID=3218 RepID=A9RWT1_PHYPA|nr:uncharacterized protein LOC112295632 isoform X1 [Physcomitrium patens]PNR35501.1 hypothetical protein PHYPA_023401 [Physcomitrium patens]|eukprot:XP_024403232.1 uncharacterized protein LOC112295632 isoform X1 [Physcomitrella patens]